ncbi:MAG: carboxypeptidase M32 [Thermoplasmata archaeon]
MDIWSDFLKEYRMLYSLNYSQRLMNFDFETHMPELGQRWRGDAVSLINILEKKEFIKLYDKYYKILENNSDNDFKNGILRIMNRTYHFYSSIDDSLLMKISKKRIEATQAWMKAKKENNFLYFSSHLNDIVYYSKEIADRLGWKNNRYNALLDLYEEDFNVQKADYIFEYILNNLKEIVEKVFSENVFTKSSEIKNVEYKIEDMKKLNYDILRIFDIPMDRFGLFISEHPFTIGISYNDVRITTRYYGKNFKSSLFSTIHEMGHGIYELQKDKFLEYTPVQGSPSLGIHESQSRFFENIIGKSKSFIKNSRNLLNRRLRFLRKYSDDDIYYYFNEVERNVIRVDADELTYNIHIAIRYFIEKDLINEKIEAEDVPKIWNEMYEKYLGVEPKNDSEGCLQDIHWAHGSFGYFPTYTLGNILSAMIYEKGFLIKDYLDSWNIKNIKDYLHFSIHRYGSVYSPENLLKISFGEYYNPEYLIKYLKDKYLS